MYVGQYTAVSKRFIMLLEVMLSRYSANVHSVPSVSLYCSVYSEKVDTYTPTGTSHEHDEYVWIIYFSYMIGVLRYFACIYFLLWIVFIGQSVTLIEDICLNTNSIYFRNIGTWNIRKQILHVKKQTKALTSEEYNARHVSIHLWHMQRWPDW